MLFTALESVKKMPMTADANMLLVVWEHPEDSKWCNGGYIGPYDPEDHHPSMEGTTTSSNTETVWLRIPPMTRI